MIDMAFLVPGPLAHAAGWTAQMPVVMMVAVLGAAYLRAMPPARARAGTARPRVSRLQRRRAAAFFAGLLTVLATLTGPIGTFADELFWMHMVQHVLLLTVAAPLFVLAAPWTLPLRLLPPADRRRAVSWWRDGCSARPLRAAVALLAMPTVAWLLFNANLLAWHVPPLFDLTLRSQPAHDVEHVLFLGLGVLFWAHALDTPPLHARLGNLQRAVLVTAATAVGWALSLALALAPSALYAGYAALATRPGGLSALADQRVAAGVMLVPGSIAFVVAAMVNLTRWLAKDEARPAPVPHTTTRLPVGANNNRGG